MSVAKWPHTLKDPYIVVLDAAIKKSINSSIMKASVNISGDCMNKERRSEEF